MLTKRKRVPLVSQYRRSSFLYTLRFANKTFRFAVTKHFVLRIIDDFEDGYEAELLESQPERRQLAETTGIRSIKQVGMMYVGVEPLQIFDVTVSDRVMMERNRVNIQRLIRAVMDQFSCAFILFHYEDDTRWDWRFS